MKVIGRSRKKPEVGVGGIGMVVGRLCFVLALALVRALELALVLARDVIPVIQWDETTTTRRRGGQWGWIHRRRVNNHLRPHPPRTTTDFVLALVLALALVRALRCVVDSRWWWWWWWWWWW